MSITIEGYCVVVKKERINDLLAQGAITPPNAMHVADDHIWRCGFMAESDAEKFMRDLEAVDLNGSQGPDSDAVIINEFNQEVHPYCEWLQTAKWEKAILAWKVGTDPQKLFAREGFDPKVGSGLSFHDPSAMDDLEFLRLDGNVEVYYNKKLGQEVYLGRTARPAEATFNTACDTIGKHFRTAEEPPLIGQDATDVGEAVEALGELLKDEPNWWQALFYHGKGLIALGQLETAFESLSRAYEIETEVEAIPRELGGICLASGKFEEAVKINEKAVSLKPDDAESLGNLALAYLLAGKTAAARKSIDAAQAIDPTDAINQTLTVLIQEVETGQRPQPESMADLNKAANKKIQNQKGAKSKAPFWQFWKK